MQTPTGEPKLVCHAAHSAEARPPLIPEHAAADGPANFASVQGSVVSIVNHKSELLLGFVVTGQRLCAVEPYTSSEQRGWGSPAGQASTLARLVSGDDCVVEEGDKVPARARAGLPFILFMVIMLTSSTLMSVVEICSPVRAEEEEREAGGIWATAAP